MRKLLTGTLIFLMSLTFVACGADGNIDEALLRDFVDEFQEEVLPTKEEFKRMAEAKIAEMPADDQPQARKDLADALAKWPTNEEIDAMVDDAVSKLPSRTEIDEALDQLDKIGDDVPGGKTLRNLIENAIENDLPSGAAVNELVQETMDDLKVKLDSMERAARKQ